MPTPPNESPSTTVSTYDLVLLLDTEVEQGARAGIVKGVKESISSDGELLRHDEWGNRELAYPIRHREQAEYHLLQFHPARADLLHGLDRSLRIADEVLRFRIVKLKPGTPDPPDMRSGHGASEHTAGRDAGRPGRAASTPAPTAPAPAPEAPATQEAGAAAEDAAATEVTAATEDAATGPDENTSPAPAAPDAQEGSAAAESA
jgi:small subunit ribosomal protein S6